jgi:hypothetical protein
MPVLLEEVMACQHSLSTPKGESGLIMTVHTLITSPLLF